MLDVSLFDVSPFDVSPITDRAFSLRGELDIATAPSLMDSLRPALDGSGDVVLDLDELSFMDSSGIKAMVEIAAGLEDGILWLRNPRGEVGKVLQIVGIDRHGNLRVAKTEQAGT